jgi:hypothetical protein
MLGAKNSQPRFHENKENPSPVWRMGAAANRYISEDGQDANGVFNYDFTTNLATFTTPVLFIAGAWSEVLGESLQQEQISVPPRPCRWWTTPVTTSPGSRRPKYSRTFGLISTH